MISMDTEVWRQIGETTYWVSNYGRVFSEPRYVPCLSPQGIKCNRRKNGVYLGMNLSPSGYLRVNIHGDVVHVHRLVALSFHGEPDDISATVNHIDLIKTNNRADNLERVSQSENSLHAWANGANDHQCKSIVCIETGRMFRSIHEAAASEKKAVGNLCSHLKGRQQTFSGKTWAYV